MLLDGQRGVAVVNAVVEPSLSFVGSRYFAAMFVVDMRRPELFFRCCCSTQLPYLRALRLLSTMSDPDRPFASIFVSGTAVLLIPPSLPVEL